MSYPTKIFLPGQIITINPECNIYSADDFVLVSRDLNNSNFSISEFIDLNTFPSTNDYHGSSYIIDKETTALILKVIGKPHRIQRKSRTNCYMVYSILIEGKKWQCFGGVLKGVN